jgi:DNA-binding transcriptional LysR family regulator
MTIRRAYASEKPHLRSRHMQECIMHDWDDLRIFLVAARTGSARAAARALGLNQSTVSRRLTRMEEKLGVRVFDRRPYGFELTDSGAELLQLAGEVEAQMDTVNRRLHGRDLSLRGRVRLSVPDFAIRPVAQHVGEFAKQFPRIEVELIADNGFARLAQREADLVLRLSASPRPQLVGRRIGPVRAAVFCAPDYLDGRAKPTELRTLDWVRWDEPFCEFPTERWVTDNVPPERVRARINTSDAMTELLAGGVGVGFKVCYAGDADPRLCRASAPYDFGLTLWLLTHDDLKGSGRVRALLRFLGDALAIDQNRFWGREGAN